jgi:RimK family alpha-L-glutamate ligase
MKISLITTEPSLEIQQLTEAVSKAQHESQIISFQQLNLLFGFGQPENTNAQGFLEADYYISRTPNNAQNGMYLEMRTTLFELFPHLVDRFLNGHSYLRYPNLSKIQQLAILDQKELPIPKTCYGINTLSYPFVLKGIHGSNGLEVHLIKNDEELKQYQTQYGEGGFLTQELFDSHVDYRVLILGKKVLGFLKKVGGDEFVTNIHVGGKAEKAEGEKETELGDLALATAAAFECEFCGIDIMYDNEGKPKVLEINRAPGWQGFQMVNEVNVATEIIEYVTQKK